MAGMRHTRAYEAFLERLREAREEAGFTQVEVAKRLRTTQKWVSRCETGDRRLDVLEAARFADLYDTTLDALVSGASREARRRRRRRK